MTIEEFLKFAEAVASLNPNRLSDVIDHDKVKEAWDEAIGDKPSPVDETTTGELLEGLEHDHQYNRFYSRLDGRWYEHSANIIPNLLNVLAESIQNRSLALGGGYTILEQASCIIRAQQHRIKRLNENLKDYQDILENLEKTAPKPLLPLIIPSSELNEYTLWDGCQVLALPKEGHGEPFFGTITAMGHSWGICEDSSSNKRTRSWDQFTGFVTLDNITKCLFRKIGRFHNEQTQRTLPCSTTP